MTYQELRQKVIALQGEISALNHKLEKPSLCCHERRAINKSLRSVSEKWYDAMSEMHSHPDYTGSLGYLPENNPFR